jgi:Flp pilus assembly pilin Flp
MHYLSELIQAAGARLAPVRGGRGQGLAEYALILALVAIVAIIALVLLGRQVSAVLSDVGNSV